jgi:carbamoyl-phosphate synthase large subunit
MINKNILITSAGVATAINVISALRNSKKIKCKITATDISIDSPGLFLADNYYLTPQVTDEFFLSELIKIIKQESIDFIFPLHSSEIHFFSKNKLALQNVGVGIVIPEIDVIQKCENKDQFQLFLKNNNFSYPTTFESKTQINNFPVFIKLKKGSSSAGAHKINNRSELNFYLKGQKGKYIIQEYIDWEEITIDCYVNSNQFLIGFVPRYRIKVKDGKSVVAKTMFNLNLLNETARLLNALKYKGACNLQVFYKEGNIKIIELNPRLSAGGLPLTIEAGINIPELMINDYYNTISNDLLEYNQDLKMYRYLTEIFK